MRREIVVFGSRRKQWATAEAFAAGFGGRLVELERAKVVPGALHILGGLQFGALELLQALRAQGEQYVFYDRAYFGGGPGSGRYRVTLNAYQQHWIRVDADLARLQALGVQLQPLLAGQGEHLLLVPPSPAVSALFGLGDWAVQMSGRLAQVTDRPVRISVKGDPVPLGERLRDCRAVVTWSSNVAVEALCAGVPAYVGPESAAAPAAGSIEAMEKALLVSGRVAWAASLAWGQFTVEEIRNGFCKGVLGL